MNRRCPWAGVLLVLLLAATVATGQQNATERALNEVLFRSRAYELLRHLSDEIGGRLSTSPAAERAVAWAEEEFRRAGTTAVHREPFPMLGWESLELSAEVVKPNHSIHLTPYANTPSLETTAPVVDLGRGTAAEFAEKKEALAGSLLLVGSGEAPQNLEEYLSAYLQVPGIVARAVEARAATLLLVHFQPGQILYQTVASSGRAAPLPIFRVTREDGLWLRRRLAAGEPTALRVRSRTRLRPQAQSWNVVAEVRGSEQPEEIVLVGAHLDSIGAGTGALDNGAGSAALLDLARLLSRSEALRPRRTVRFVLFTGEEEGIVGSMQYVRAHKEELDRIVAMVNMDTGAGRVVAYENTGRPDVEARLKALVSKLGPLGPRAVRLGQSWYSDHGPFVLAGVPAFFLLQDTSEYETYIHTQADTFDKVDPDDYRAACAVLAATVVEIANLPERFARRWTREEIRRLLAQTGEDRVLQTLGLPLWSLE
ncbi:MAG: M20/M25/M40 family metallo-hydrolase [Terriglobia bacterium]